MKKTILLLAALPLAAHAYWFQTIQGNGYTLKVNGEACQEGSPATSPFFTGQFVYLSLMSWDNSVESYTFTVIYRAADGTIKSRSATESNPATVLYFPTRKASQMFIDGTVQSISVQKNLYPENFTIKENQ